MKRTVSVLASVSAAIALAAAPAAASADSFGANSRAAGGYLPSNGFNFGHCQSAAVGSPFYTPSEAQDLNPAIFTAGNDFGETVFCSAS